MRKLIIILFCISFMSIADVLEVSPEEQKILDKISNYNGQKTFLLSYPRSGNTWMRYCLEFLTKRPSGPNLKIKYLGLPIGWTCNFEIDCDKAPIIKVHEKKEIRTYNPHNDYLILVIRNPKEAITREGKTDITYEILQGKAKINGYQAPVYFENIKFFDQWGAKKIVIYYEDLLTNPQATLEKILGFLQEPKDFLESFIADYKKHQEAAIQLYSITQPSGSQSQGEDLLFHSRKNYTPEYRKKIDRWIEELYPNLWNKYLKNRYSEAILHY